MNQVLFIFFIEKQESKFDRRLYLIIQVLLSTTMDNRSSRKGCLKMSRNILAGSSFFVLACRK